MSTGDWLEGAIRVLAVISMGAATIRGVRRMRQQGAATTALHVVTAVLVLLYLAGGVLLVAGYFIFTAPEHALLFGIVAILYFAGGLFLVAKMGACLESRLTSKARN